MQRFRSIERDHVELALQDGRTLLITRVRDPRARRMKLCVDERGARLTLPLRASAVSGKRFLDENRDWLAMQLARYATDAVNPLQAGETAALPLRAQLLPLRWSEGRYTRLQRDDHGLLFSVTARAGDATLSRALRDFYEGEARVDLGRWLPRYLPTLPRPPRRVRFKVMSSQWGSLAPDDSIALDLSLVLARPTAFEYVLVHELCHLLQPDHSRAFWRQVETRFPEWCGERDWFHAHGRQVKATLRTLLG